MTIEEMLEVKILQLNQVRENYNKLYGVVAAIKEKPELLNNLVMDGKGGFTYNPKENSDE